MHHDCGADKAQRAKCVGSVQSFRKCPMSVCLSVCPCVCLGFPSSRNSRWSARKCEVFIPPPLPPPLFPPVKRKAELMVMRHTHTHAHTLSLQGGAGVWTEQTQHTGALHLKWVLIIKTHAWRKTELRWFAFHFSGGYNRTHHRSQRGKGNDRPQTVNHDHYKCEKCHLTAH